jgi:DNA-binding transcriptional LysR family regulator
MNTVERQQRPISTDMLCAFLKVAECRSVSQAAVSLDVAKSLISKRIAQLEERLEATLFSRSTRKVALTPAGEAYVDYAKRALAEVSDGMERVRALRTELSGNLRLTAPVSWGQRVLAKHLPEFLKLHPALEIDLMLTDRMMDMATERIDIALRWSSHSHQERHGTPMTEIKWLLTAAPAYIAQHGLPAQPHELNEHPCVYYRRDNTDDHWTLIRHPAADQSSPRTVEVKVGGRYRVDNPEAVLESAIAGMGIALLPDYLCTRAVEQGALVKVLTPWTPQTKFGTHIVALCPPERKKISRNQALIEHLQRSLTQDMRHEST